jgi:hypothetical protein
MSRTFIFIFGERSHTNEAIRHVAPRIRGIHRVNMWTSHRHERAATSSTGRVFVSAGRGPGHLHASMCRSVRSAVVRHMHHSWNRMCGANNGLHACAFGSHRGPVDHPDKRKALAKRDTDRREGRRASARGARYEGPPKRCVYEMLAKLHGTSRHNRVKDRSKALSRT